MLFVRFCRGRIFGLRGFRLFSFLTRFFNIRFGTRVNLWIIEILLPIPTLEIPIGFEGVSGRLVRTVDAGEGSADEQQLYASEYVVWEVPPATAGEQSSSSLWYLHLG